MGAGQLRPEIFRLAFELMMFLFFPYGVLWIELDLGGKICAGPSDSYSHVESPPDAPDI